MTWWWDCECIQYGFDLDHDIGGEGADALISRARRGALEAMWMRMASWTGRVGERCIATAAAGIWAALIFLCALSARMA